MRSRQYLGCLRVRDGTLTLEQLHFADEVDPPAGIVPDELPSVAKKELDMALTLIEGFSGEWQPEKYEDTYTAALREVVKAKRRGKDVHELRRPEEEEAPPDLMEALRLSIEQSQRSRARTKKRTTAKRR
jgi:DNA end-binding protein Ku